MDRIENVEHLEALLSEPTELAVETMAELDGEATIITLDRDFAVYRRGRSAIRLIAPFAKP